MIQSWGWHGKRQNKLVIQDTDRKEVEKRIKNAQGFKPVLIKGEPMEIKEEISLKGDLYYAIVLEREKPLLD